MKSKILFITICLTTLNLFSEQSFAKKNKSITNRNQASTKYPGSLWSPPKAKYGSDVIDNVSIPMDDGISLVAQISYPKDLKTGQRAKGKFPVVIEHMPYERFAVPLKVNTFFSEHGYISLFVRARGLGGSGGEVQFLTPREGLDGKNIVDWASSKLEGSDGRVALIGCSWPGAIALNDAAYVGKKSPLKAVVAACSGLENMSRQSWFSGGLPTTSYWMFDARGIQLVGQTPAAERFFKNMTDSVMNGNDVAYNKEFWSERGRDLTAQKIVENDIPVLLWAGWKDVVEMGTIRAYISLQNAYAGLPIYSQTNPNKTSPKYQLILGGWSHTEGLDMGLYLQWIETWLKGRNTGIQKTKTPMHVYEQGTNRWLNLASFPKIDKYTKLKLAPGKLIDDQLLSEQTEILKYTEPESADGTKKFISEPFNKGATLSGPMSIKLYASSTNTNLVIIAKLFDVDENGNDSFITRGAIVGSLRNLDINRSWKTMDGTVVWPWPKLDKDDYLIPNKVYSFDLSLTPRQWGIKPGHRIRLELTTQTSKKLCPAEGAPGMNDADPCRLTGPQLKSVPGGEYTLYFGEHDDSSLHLPLLPYQAFKNVKEGYLRYPWNEVFRKVESEPAKYTLPLEW